MSFQQRFIGATELPKSLTELDVGLSFRLSSADAEELRKKFRDKRLGAAVLLVFVRASGRQLGRFGTVPRTLLSYLCVALGLNETSIASLKSLYKRPATLTEHLKWVEGYCGLSYPSDTDLAQLKLALEAITAAAASVDELVAHAQRWLFDKKLLLPNDREIRDVARAAFAAQELASIYVVKQQVPAKQLTAAVAAMFSSRKGRGGGSILEWLRTGPAKHSKTTLADTSKKVEYLKSLGVDQWTLQGISSERIRAYAQAVIHRPPIATKRLSGDQQVLELACFLRATLLELTDAAFYMAGRRMSDFIRMARNKVQAKQAKNAVDLRQRDERARKIIYAEGTADRDKVLALQSLFPQDDGEQNLSRAALVRESLADERVRLSALLSALSSIDIQGPAKDRALQQVQMLKALKEQGARELPDGFDTSMAEPVWHNLLNGKDRAKALGALQASAVMAVHKGLRGGRLWIDHSWKHRNREDMLISAEEWKAQRKQIIAAMGLFSDPKLYVKRVRHNLEVGLRALSEAVAAGKLEIDENGLVRLPALSPQDIDTQVTHTRDAIFKIIGPTQFCDVLVQVDAAAGFSEVLLGRRAKDRVELLACYGGLLALGTENDAKGVAAMIPGMEVSHVTSAMRTLENESRLRQANRRVLDFQLEHGVAQLWGKGDKASSDMMALDTSRHLFNARVDPRRRTFAAGIYTHVLETYGIFYDQPIVLNTRQAAAAVQGAHWYNAQASEDKRIAWLAVDTHGYTNVAMATAKLVGFDLCPQLRNLSERKLYLLHGMEVPENLERLAIRCVSEKSICEAWDEALRVVASVKGGRLSPRELLERVGSDAAGSPLYKSLDSLGRLLRSIFLCDYFSNVDFRREIHTVLNRGESVHLLQRAIHFGRVPADRGRRAAEMSAISGAHVLLTNIVIAWNTAKMQEVVDRWKREKHPIEDSWLAHMGPVHFGEINFRGTFAFGLEAYEHALVQAPVRRHAA